MATVTITNLTSASLPLNDFYVTLGHAGSKNSGVAPIDNIVLADTQVSALTGLTIPNDSARPADWFGELEDTMALLVAGSISVVMTPSATEVSSGLMQPQTVVTSNIANLAVTAAKIANATITHTQISATAAIANTQLAAGSVVTGSDAATIAVTAAASGVVVAGAVIGDLVLSCLDVTTTPPTLVNGAYESTVSVTGQIQQTSATGSHGITTLDAVIVTLLHVNA